MLCRLQHPYMRPCTRTLNPKPCLLSGTGCTIHAMFAPSRFTELFEFATLTAPPFPGSPFCIFLLHALTSFRMLVVAVVLHNPESSLVKCMLPTDGSFLWMATRYAKTRCQRALSLHGVFEAKLESRKTYLTCHVGA